MLIHSVTPSFYLTEQPDYPKTAFKPFEGGYLEGFDSPDGFVINRLSSTDPSLYLKKEFSPGGVYGGRGQLTDNN